MCYVVPLVAAGAVTIVHSTKKSPKTWWLALMFYGAALFGVIDHLWHGELFLVSEKPLVDIMLGFAITAGIFICWLGLLLLSKFSLTLKSYITTKQM